MKTYILTSSPAIYAPGFVRAMRRFNRLNKEATAKAANIYTLMHAYPEAPGWVILALVEGRYRVDERNDSVIVERAEALNDAEPKATSADLSAGGAL
jgi:hypothetical protein